MQKGLIYFMAVLMPFFVYGNKNEMVVYEEPSSQEQFSQEEQVEENNQSEKLNQAKKARNIAYNASMLSVVGGYFIGGGYFFNELALTGVGTLAVTGGIALCEYQFYKVKKSLNNSK